MPVKIVRNRTDKDVMTAAYTSKCPTVSLNDVRQLASEDLLHTATSII
jgi:hypothetical protein